MPRVRAWQRQLIELAETEQECPKCHQTWNATMFCEEGRNGVEVRVKCRQCRDKAREQRKASADQTDKILFALRHQQMSDGGHKGNRRFASQVPQTR